MGMGDDGEWASWAFLADPTSNIDLTTLKLLEQLCSEEGPRGQAELQMQPSVVFFLKSQQMGGMFLF